MAGIKMTRKEEKRYLAFDPKISDTMSSLVSRDKLPRTKKYLKDVKTAVAIARKFNEEVVRPVYKEIDLKVAEDPNYLVWDFINTANEWGLFSLWIPRIFGGKGLDFLSLYPFLEEIASVCTGLSNVIGVHYLGIATQCASWNIKLMNKVWREVKKGEKTGKPCLISLTITEPDAGTDLEEVDLLSKARVGTIAKKVEGGYIVNGRKIFISNGHTSTWHMVICYEDKKNPHENMLMLAVKNGTKGFSFGTHEKKMGQKSCVASELIFEDCFVSDKNVCVSARNDAPESKEDAIKMGQVMIDFVVSSSRAGVAAFATGCARGAYETAFDYAVKKDFDGKTLAHKQWSQTTLAEMYKNVNMSRAIYLESAYANLMSGMFKVLNNKILFRLINYLPTWWYNIFVSPFMNLKIVTKFFRKVMFDWYTKEEAELTSGWGSLVKFSCSDLAITNSQMAIELMGVDGCRHDIGAEKYLRDAKLLQIYEGTNQLNRLNLFKCLIGRNIDGLDVF